MGNNALGVTGRGVLPGDTVIASAIDVSNLGDRQITQIAAGNNHSLLLADDGTVYSFGDNSSGKTGLGTSFGGTRIATPINNSNFIGKKVKKKNKNIYI